MGDCIVLSDQEKAAYQNDLSSVHDIFKRPILIYRKAEKVIISENIDFIYPYSDGQLNNDVSSYNIASGVFSARIWHMPAIGGKPMTATTSKSASEFTARGEPQLRFDNDKNIVRLK